MIFIGSLCKDMKQDMNENNKLGLLFVTQVIDQEDSILGFVVKWVAKMVNRDANVVVLARKMNQTDLPTGSQGEELGVPKIQRIMKMWYYSFKYRKSYEAVLVHMTPEMLVMGWPVWFILRKRIYLWYMHGSVTPWLRVALSMCRKAFTASDLSLRVDSFKKTVVGHGIDTDQFRPMDDVARRPNILTVGRISPRKNLDGTLDFLAGFKQRYPDINWRLTIIGSAQGQSEYLDKLKQRVKDLGLEYKVDFVGPKLHDELPAYYASSAVLISTSETGSIDKVVLESLACGTPVLAMGKEYWDLPGVLPLNDVDRAYAFMAQQLQNPSSLEAAREAVIKGHDLDRLMGVLVDEMTKSKLTK